MELGRTARAREAPGPPRRSAETFERERVRARVRARVFGGEAAPLRLGRYLILDRIAAGGTSIVYRAEDEELGRLVAVKLVLQDLGRGPELRKRLAREGRALAQLDHPGTVRVYDVGLDDGLAFIVVELVEGETLADWLARETRGWRDALDVLLPVGDALAAAHEVGLIHRDVKPANVLLDVRGMPRLADFGFARALDAPAGDQTAPRLRLAPEGDVTSAIGTPAYMAPEQWNGAASDARTDQFGYCVTLFEALFGERPIGADGRARLPDSNVTGDDSIEAERDVPAWLRAIVSRGMAAQPEARFDSLPDLLSAVRARLESVEREHGAEATIARMRRENDPPRRLELGMVARRMLDEALAQWPENPDAAIARNELLATMFDDAVRAGHVENAAAVLSALDDADGALGARLAAAREALDEPARRLEHLERERDTRVEERFKARSIALSAAGWMLAYVAYAMLDRMQIIEVTPLTLLPFFVLYSAAGWLGLRSLPAKYAANRVNRDLTIVASLVTTGHAVATLACAALGASTATALMFAHVQAATGYAIAGLAYDRRAAWLTPSNILGAALIATWPDYALEISVVIVPLGSSAWVLSHRRGEREATMDDASPDADNGATR